MYSLVIAAALSTGSAPDFCFKAPLPELPSLNANVLPTPFLPNQSFNTFGGNLLPNGFQDKGGNCYAPAPAPIYPRAPLPLPKKEVVPYPAPEKEVKKPELKPEYPAAPPARHPLKKLLPNCSCPRK